jgi:hypothetical protein
MKCRWELSVAISTLRTELNNIGIFKGKVRSHHALKFTTPTWVTSLASHGMAWHGMAWHGMAWHGVAWNGVAWHGMAWLGRLHIYKLYENLNFVVTRKVSNGEIARAESQVPTSATVRQTMLKNNVTN